LKIIRFSDFCVIANEASGEDFGHFPFLYTFVVYRTVKKILT